MFKRLLIANRGEIACRIIRTAQKMGISSIAIYSDADHQAQHVIQADEAYRVGPAPSRESYLNSTAIIKLAQQVQADAIHPGYGFLAENADFAMACVAAKISFIGPSAQAIQAMGHKAAAKQLMSAAGIPLLPSYHDKAQDLKHLQTIAEQIGYPLLIKAVAGGGGKGMRVVWQASDFAEQLAAAKREALTSFGNDDILLEKFLINPRHIEVQVFADQQGNVVHLFDRDCSIQRRYQKIIEEAPAPNIPTEVRAELYQTAIKACQTINYVGAGTIEFIYTADQQFYFMEMNTRLQVEHPITELITGHDLVEWQLRVAAGEPLPLSQAQISSQGHAIEARLCAENPKLHFLPSSGQIHFLQWPATSNTLRIDTGIAAGDQISSYYDSMLAKLIVHGNNRLQANQFLQQALANCQIIGVQTNLNFLNKIITSPAFQAAELHTQFIEQHATQLLDSLTHIPPNIWLAACLYILLQQKQLITSASHLRSPWQIFDGWRLNGTIVWYPISLKSDEQNKLLEVQFRAQDYIIKCDEQTYVVSGKLIDEQQLQLAINGQTTTVRLISLPKQLHLLHQADHFIFEQEQTDYSTAPQTKPSLTSPLPGTITAIFVQPDQVVQVGEALLAVEAMKMEYIIRAPYAGTVAQLYYQVGDQVKEGKNLIHLLQLTKHNLNPTD